MKKTISNRINMYVVTLETCKRYEEEWAGIPKLVSAVNDFENALNEINAIAVSHSIKTLGVSSYKMQKLEKLFEVLLDVHAAYTALAVELNDPGMRIRHHVPYSVLSRMNTVALKTHIASVAEELIATGSSLEPYGIDNNRIAEILQVIEESTAIISKPRLAIVERKSLTASLDTKVEEIDRIVKLRIDNMVRLLKRALPDFFNEYFAARKVINSGVRHNKPTNGTSSGALGTIPNEPDDGN